MHNHNHSADAHHSHDHAAGEHESKLGDYMPLVWILLAVLAAVAVWEVLEGRFDLRESVRVFMGFFFLIFGLIKTPDLKGFVSAFADYDIVAGRVRVYGYVYPFIEIALGLLYLLNLYLFVVLWATVLVMAVSSVGVIRAVSHGRQIRCACAGTLFNLPMSTVTIVEDVGMGAMAVLMLVI